MIKFIESKLAILNLNESTLGLGGQGGQLTRVCGKKFVGGVRSRSSPSQASAVSFCRTQKLTPRSERSQEFQALLPSLFVLNCVLKEG